MLSAEDFDEDYFTPVASASLANIFGKPSVNDEGSDNKSLKYSPPKNQNVSQQPEDSKATSCIFACALVGYEWHNNVYSEKGKLGFAILNILKTGSHNIILYDSNKTTLSNTTVSDKLTVTVKSNNYISYYDNQTKYWSLYGTENEIQKITNLLKTLQVIIVTSSETDVTPPEPAQIENRKVKSIQENKTHESDTDSSMNRKTKASILNRMANMGHSVLPPSSINVGKTSDSSDTNDTDTHIKAVRHKPVKAIFKRSHTDKTVLDHHKDNHDENAENSRIPSSTSSQFQNINYPACDQLVPLANSTIVTGPAGNEMNLFVTEQRISNSELRINMGRISDKLDHMADKINLLEMKAQNEGATNLNTELLNKLLREYENKINVYENLFKNMGTDIKIPVLSNIAQCNNNEELLLKNKIKLLESVVNEKDKTISSLQNEIQELGQRKQCHEDRSCDDFAQKIADLEKELSRNQDLIKELSEKNEKLSNTQNVSVIENKIKSVMNETYQAVATNFETEVSYSGDTIKKTIATVIKKVTVIALNEE